MGRLTLSAANNYDKVGTYAGVETANSHELIDMLFGGLLQRLTAAKGAINSGNISVKGESLTKAINIIDGLRESINFELGGEIAYNLENLYVYMQTRLLTANLENSIDDIDEVVSLVLQIKGAWATVCSEYIHDKTRV